jgi:predicted phosphodiesterase
MKLIITFLLTTIYFSMHENKDQNARPLVTFGVVADVQYADNDPAGNRYYRNSGSRLKEAYDSFRRDSVDFVVNLGDLIDGDFSSYAPMMNIISSSGIKTYHVTGNHDYAVENRYKSRLPVLSGHRKGYYSFSKEDFTFIFLNGNEISTYASSNKASVKEGSEYLEMLKARATVNAVEWNGGISKTQLDWLKEQLDMASAEKRKVMIFCHFPVYPENVHNLFNYKEVLQILGKYNNIIAWMSGHNHAGNYGNFNMIHFVTFRGMVESDDRNSYATVEIYRNKIWIRASGREKNQILAY